MVAACIPLVFFAEKKKNGTISVSPKSLHILLGLSAGLLFAVATVELIPDAFSFEAKIEAAHNHDDEKDNTSHDEHGDEHQHHSVKYASLGIALGFFLLLAMDSIFKMMGFSHSHSEGPSAHGHSHGSVQTSDEELVIHFENSIGPKNINYRHSGSLGVTEDLQAHLGEGPHGHSHQEVGHEEDDHVIVAERSQASSDFETMACIGLSVHNFIDGLVIAGAWQAGAEVGTRVAVALILHKFPDGFLLSSVLAQALTDWGSKKKNVASSLYKILLICSMTPLGALCGQLILKDLSSPAGLAFILGSGGGTFIFLACTAILPELVCVFSF